ncbi:hypothetical protein K502DRAFT_325968 [Neoconidiobolus thromboides FSU 785]|nr:hypothetical protein K502DRAFT_325968 [Neoconidiobolus thromboides FSU 785]
MNTLDHQQFLQMEKAFIMAPFELMRKNTDAQFRLVKTRTQNIKDNFNRLKEIQTDQKLSTQEKVEKYDKIINYINELKDKINSSHNKEKELISGLYERTQAINELGAINNMNDPKFSGWSLKRLNRVVLDYLLRNGFIKTAREFSSNTDLNKIADFDLFEQILKVEEALKKHSCRAALAWCNENKKGLQKLESSFEFHLRLQEFVELARAQKHMDALAYLKKYMTPYLNEKQEEVEQYFGILAFPNDTECYPYKAIYSIDRWNDLIKEFRNDCYNLHSLPEQPPLIISLKAGLASLKTPYCLDTKTQNPDCPCCQVDTFGKIAETLPFAHFTNSTLKCNITNTLMDEHNIPMVLPNGKVYSKKAIDEQKEINHSFVCPETKESFSFDSIKKVYIS